MPQCLEASGIAPVASCLVSSEQIPPTQGEHSSQSWGQSLRQLADQLDIARCCEAIAEYDLGEGVAAIGRSLALWERELALLSG